MKRSVDTARAAGSEDVGFAVTARVGRLALSGVSAAALTLALATLPSGQSLAQSVVDGAGGSGQIVLSGTQTLSNSVYTNYNTTGGSGSGGGGGLGGAVFVGSGATVTINNSDFVGNTATGGTGGVGATGGGLNGYGTGTAGSNGANGRDGSDAGAYVAGQGAGASGQNGFNASNGTSGVGGKGGNGGEGGDGAAETAQQVKALAEQVYTLWTGSSETVETTQLTALATAFTALATAAAAGVPPVGDNATLMGQFTTAAAAFSALATDKGSDAGASVTKAAAEAAFILAIEVTSYAEGVSGMGGGAGSGGSGGNGSFGYGGGAGGDGGNGGDAVWTSAASGGDGGSGGSGGNGGFGAGGGLGGSGGDGGSDGSSANHGPHDGSGGSGGSAGFGGGVGSTGDGTANGTGGGGGAAYGGAIFVQSGGTLNLTGNMLFDGNSVFGGSSENDGASGNQAGSDLFMMKGSTVNLNPGDGNTIIFNGNIADDSKANIGESSINSGAGAGLDVQSGLVIFNGINSYTGQTKISGGVLQAIDGKSVNGAGGIHMDSNINLAGGVLQSNGTFTRYLGTNSGRVQWTGSGGFAAAGGDLAVNLHNGQQLTWGNNSFISGNNSLLFGSDSADGDVHFKNAINLGGGVRSIIANGGALGENVVYMDGVISNGGLALGDGTTEGIVTLTRANTYGLGTSVATGTTLKLEGAGAIASSSEVAIAGTLDISAATAGAALVTLSGAGDVVLGDKTLTLANASTTFSGDVQGAGNLKVSGGTQTLSGVNSYTGTTTVDAGAGLNLTLAGDISASAGLLLDGTFSIAGLTDTGTEIGYLTGASSGVVTLGSKTLTITDAEGTFAGTIGGTGDLVIAAGSQTLTGVSSYSGTTTIEAGATLAMKEGGSIATSAEVVADGTFDISQILVPSAYITTLSGSGSVVLDQFDDDVTDDDEKTLVISEAADTNFSGVISGDGGVIIEASTGAQTFSGINTYLGSTLIDLGGTLRLADDGSIAASSGITANGTFDIAGVNHPDNAAWIKTLAGAGSVTLGANTLVITAGNGEIFSGVISGSGGLVLSGDSEQTLSGDNSYTGQTEIGEDATLKLADAGDISESLGLLLSGTFDIADITSAAAAITDLSGDGIIELGGKRINVTAAASTFSGTVNGTGGFGVTGGTQTLSGATLNTSLTVDSTGKLPADNAKAIVSGSSITANGGSAALNIVNGGAITTTDTTVTADAAPFAYAGFNEADKIATFTIGTGTVMAGNFGAINEGDPRTLLMVDRSGAGSNGIVNFIIDNDAVIAGDIIDMVPKTDNGGTYVTVKASASWSGLANAASFVVENGASAFFDDGSIIDGNLTAEAGATILGSTLLNPLVINGDGFVENGILRGNLYFAGNLNLDGFMTPGASPGYVNVGGDLNVASIPPDVSTEFGPSTLLEVTFGLLAPQPGNGGDYDQLNIGGDLNGTLPVTLANVVPNGPRSTPLGNLADIELIRVGGTVNGSVVQSNRLTQNGHEVRIAAPYTVAATTDGVVGIPVDEQTFFGSDITVFGLEAFVQDETYGLATLTGSTHQASDAMLGTFADRRGSGSYTDMEAGWLRFGANYTEVVDTVSNNQTVGFGQIGLDIIRAGDLRAGVLASYGNAHSDVGTYLGTAKLDGTLYSGGVHASWASGGAYVEALGQYGYSDWTFSPVEADGALTAVGHTATASIEAGLGIGDDNARVTPWGQFLYQTSSYENVESPWIDGVDFLNPASMQVRGGVRAEANFYGFAPYAGVAVAHDLSEYKAVVVDGYEFGTAMGGTRVEFGAGFAATVADSVKLTTDFKGAYGIGPGEVVGYQGQAGLRASW
jgi:fibronectin-binding autotransporter adhesin